MFNKLFFYSLLIIALFNTITPLFSTEYEIKNVLEVKVNSSINPATLNYFQSAAKMATDEKLDLILIKLNTPGGLVTTTKEILTLIGESNIPVTIWITPEGASATSAGAIIASSAHFLFMSPGTNIGAATPIEMSGDIKESDGKKKAVNDLVALVEALAKERGRNSSGYKLMIEKASSYPSHIAAEENLINGIANNYEEIWTKINGKTITVKGEAKTIKIASPQIKILEMDLGQKLLDTLANPSMAYILFLIGAALLYLEFQTAGGFVAGAVGVLALLLAGIGFQLLPLNFGALGLIILSFALFIAEIFITSYGILSLAGLASLLAGSLFLYRTDNAYLTVGHTIIFSAVGAVAAFILFVFYFFVKDNFKRDQNKKEFFNLIGSSGVVTDKDHGHYIIRIGGELWSADSDESLSLNDEIIVIEYNKDQMRLKIKGQKTTKI